MGPTYVCQGAGISKGNLDQRTALAWTSRINTDWTGMQVILLAGLQGVGKTTAAGKLALLLQKKKKKVLMVATDVYRPAAIDQLVKLGAMIKVPVFEMGTEADPADIAAKGLEKAKQEKFDAVIVDTSGRLQVMLSPALGLCLQNLKPYSRQFMCSGSNGAPHISQKQRHQAFQGT